MRWVKGNLFDYFLVRSMWMQTLRSLMWRYGQWGKTMAWLFSDMTDTEFSIELSRSGRVSHNNNNNNITTLEMFKSYQRRIENLPIGHCPKKYLNKLNSKEGCYQSRQLWEFVHFRRTTGTKWNQGIRWLREKRPWIEFVGWNGLFSSFARLTLSPSRDVYSSWEMPVKEPRWFSSNLPCKGWTH